MNDVGEAGGVDVCVREKGGARRGNRSNHLATSQVHQPEGVSSFLEVGNGSQALLSYWRVP